MSPFFYGQNIYFGKPFCIFRLLFSTNNVILILTLTQTKRVINS